MGPGSGNAPFEIASGSFGLWALGYAALWGLLILMVEAGGGDLAAALSILVASGMTVIAAENVIGNFREVK
ncbi:MAG: hypothetical protein HY323_08080 [Betaproteobacteria bacterium]|nr:hypothetical protein [Betaproteobacteria bacterium]